MKVAIIGCGPSGMFFLHTLAHRRKRLEAEGDMVALALLPDVTCFERSSSPGGVWRSDRVEDKGDDKCTGMYEALWMNGPKECVEFFDYTFDEHFGCALPTYLPRKLFFEYMSARCTKDNPTFFEDVKFNTSVESVTFDEEEGKFVVQTLNRVNQSEQECTLFDKCIWAAGINGRPKIPKAIYEVLSAGGFKGKVIHSSEVGPIFDQCARGKQILMIGDSYSAEDLTLMAIKLGAETIDICSRSGEGIACDTGSWPQGRVDVHEMYLPSEVTKDGHGVVLSNGEEQITLENIETVIFCTGYAPNMDMLDRSLRANFEGPYFSNYDFPKDWKMSKHPLSKEFGDIALGKINDLDIVKDDVYRGHLISNPNMMFFFESSEIPILEIDITAWLLLAHIVGDVPLPSQEQMIEYNRKLALEFLDDPYWRYSEENFRKRWLDVDEEHWSCDTSDKRVYKMLKNYLAKGIQKLARDCFDAKYPLHIGSYENLNEIGKAFVEFNLVDSYHRYDLDEESPEASWKTFRDCDPSSKIYSVMTGTKAVPLKYRWLDIHGECKEDIVHT